MTAAEVTEKLGLHNLITASGTFSLRARPRGMACTKASIGSLEPSVARSESPCLHCTSQGGDAVRHMMPDSPCGCEECFSCNSLHFFLWFGGAVQELTSEFLNHGFASPHTQHKLGCVSTISEQLLWFLEQCIFD